MSIISSGLNGLDANMWLASGEMECGFMCRNDCVLLKIENVHEREVSYVMLRYR